MKLVLQFDCDADIIDVPQYVIDNREKLRNSFLKWIYNRNNGHRYWIKCGNSYGVQYRGDAFVEWLNKKVIVQNLEKAVLLEQHTAEYAEQMPTLFF